MKKYLWLTFCLLLCACRNDKKYHPQYHAFVEAVYASGKVQPQDGHKIFAMNDGILAEQVTQEGFPVKAGQAIFKIENTAQNARLRNASEVYRMARKNYAEETSPVLQEMQGQMNTSAIKLKNDSVNYFRFKNLIEGNATTQAEYDRASLAYKTSKNDYIVLKDRYSRTKNQLYLDLQNAESQYKIMAQDAGYTSVNSDMEGLLYETYKKQGEAVRKGEAVAFVGSAGKMYLQLWIDEEDVFKIKTGQNIYVSLDMYEGQAFKATVSKIYPVLNAENQSVRVDADFVAAMPSLVSNASAEANIIISEKEKALGIPRKLLVNKDSVWIETAEGAKKIKVNTGIQNEAYVEIVAGLDINSTVIEK